MRGVHRALGLNTAGDSVGLVDVMAKSAARARWKRVVLGAAVIGVGTAVRGFKPGDEVITTSNTAIPTVSAIVEVTGEAEPLRRTLDSLRGLRAPLGVRRLRRRRRREVPQPAVCDHS